MVFQYFSRDYTSAFNASAYCFSCQIIKDFGGNHFAPHTEAHSKCIFCDSSLSPRSTDPSDAPFSLWNSFHFAPHTEAHSKCIFCESSLSPRSTDPSNAQFSLWSSLHFAPYTEAHSTCIFWDYDALSPRSIGPSNAPLSYGIPCMLLPICRFTQMSHITFIISTHVSLSICIYIYIYMCLALPFS